MSKLHVCLSCEEFLKDTQLLEPQWVRSLPPEQQGMACAEVVCPGCLESKDLWLVEELREKVA